MFLERIKQCPVFICSFVEKRRLFIKAYAGGKARNRWCSSPRALRSPEAPSPSHSPA